MKRCSARHGTIKDGVLRILAIGTFSLLLFSLFELPSEASTKIVFSREDTIFLTDTEGGLPREIARGYDPEISPQGNRIAFTAYSDEGDRYIALASPATEEVEILSSVPGNNSYGPRWSPDGKFLLFNHWEDSKGNWVLGLLDLESRKFRILAPEQQGLFSPFWDFRGTFVYGQDLDFLYRIDVASGHVVEKKPLAEIIGNAMISSALRFSVSTDGSKWLFDGEIEGGPAWEKSDLPLISAIFLYTPEKGEVRQLTDRSVCAMHPFWLPGGEAFLFSGYTPEDTGERDFPFDLFRQSIEEKTPEKLLSRGHTPSCSQ
ncbi:MAG TPA: hypothetical protein PK364_10225 [Synergistaceae bacterium]|nr:hypothetical protein [Synergistaceae bacterium]HPJ25377.1 hypothetical protein [Synergistaceae bacterium]HPQ36066.1 hypothetical protein [Synergistaceae bacterium]